MLGPDQLMILDLFLPKSKFKDIFIRANPKNRQLLFGCIDQIIDDL